MPRAQASAVAGDRVVSVASANGAQQCLNAVLLDGLQVNLVPAMLGQGIRWFENLSRAPVEFEHPRVIEGTRVSHLHYRVRKSHPSVSRVAD